MFPDEIGKNEFLATIHVGEISGAELLSEFVKMKLVQVEVDDLARKFLEETDVIPASELSFSVIHFDQFDDRFRTVRNARRKVLSRGYANCPTYSGPIFAYEFVRRMGEPFTNKDPKDLLFISSSIIIDQQIHLFHLEMKDAKAFLELVPFDKSRLDHTWPRSYGFVALLPPSLKTPV